jgi:hypothetical protein
MTTTEIPTPGRAFLDGLGRDPDRFDQLVADYLDGRAGSTTPLGLPYPVPTDPVAQGASAIQALATALDPKVNNTLAVQQSSALLAAYPQGVSLFSLTGTQAAADPGWPFGVSSHVWTLKAASDRAVQFWFRNSATQAEAWMRVVGASSNSPWARVAGDTYRIASASATLNLSDSTYTLISWASTDSNNGDIALASNAFTTPTAGLYAITAFALFGGGGSAAAPYCLLGLGPGGSSSPDNSYRQAIPSAGGTGAVQIAGSWERPMAAGESVSLYGYQNSGAVKAVTYRRITVRRVGNKW